MPLYYAALRNKFHQTMEVLDDGVVRSGMLALIKLNFLIPA
jgi:hypothetical protein